MPRLGLTLPLFLLLLNLPAWSAPLPGPKKEVGQSEPEVHVVGLYEAGGNPLAAARGENTVRVKVQATPKRPVILVLSAYEPIRWEIEAADGAIAQVIVGAYHKQTLVGLAKGTPVQSFVYEEKSEEYFIAFRDPRAGDLSPEDRAEAKEAYETMTRKVKALTRREVKFFQGKYAARDITIRPGEKPTLN
ncbi:MAG: hypothetical protein SNJ82_10670 [Gemmataceae bacterium]